MKPQNALQNLVLDDTTEFFAFHLQHFLLHDLSRCCGILQFSVNTVTTATLTTETPVATVICLFCKPHCQHMDTAAS